MGVDLHSVNLMRLAAKAGADFSSVLTLGRLGFFLDDAELAAFCRDTGRPSSQEHAAALRGDGFCEAFLGQCFGAREVVSLDASPYDGATLIHDLNVPIARGARQFDAILDFGCLEHVFNLPVALANVLSLCRDGGHILHVTPANNWCGHGFYQFSPEMFFSLYSAERGFAGTQVFLVEHHCPGVWYRLLDPRRTGRRMQVVNRERTSTLVLTRKTAQALSPLTDPPQQSDYITQWQGAEAPQQVSPSAPPALRRPKGPLSVISGKLRNRLRRARNYLVGHKQRLRRRRADVECVEVRDLIADPVARS